MYLRKLALYDFKNYREVHFSFDTKVNCFLGKNGVGKTNVLDGIYYLGFTKSALNAVDAQNIRHGASQFIIRGEFELAESSAEVACSYTVGSKKIVRVDERETEKLSSHIGKFPIVLIAPNDIELIWGASDMRRKFFDTLISQIDRAYLENLIVYNHQLRQRNSLLRLSEHGSVDKDLLEAYDQKLIVSGTYISKKRAQFLEGFLPAFKKHYAFLIGEGDEAVDIVYKSDCAEAEMATLLKKNLSKDLALQRTNAGVHKDDFTFLLNGYDLKRIGSQGQQKSFLIGLKLAEFQSIEAATQVKPILLLDDIFDKLDDERIHKLVALVVEGTFGQLFITDARPDRSRELLREAEVEAELFTIEDGKLMVVS